MSFSIVTNVASMVAQENLRVNTDFQRQTINRLTSGYRINASGDDAAGLAVANKYRSDVAELSQGVRNANDGISSLQIVDGGLNNISKIMDRLKTLATQSGSTTFTGNRTMVNNEYQALLGEINRQASNIGLVSSGVYNTLIEVYIGGGSSVANAKVQVDLSGTGNRVDATSLGVGTSSVAGGGTTVGNLDLNNVANTFLASAATQVFTFALYDTNAAATTTHAVTVTGGATAAGSTGSAILSALNTDLASYGISAVTDANGYLAFGGTRAFSVSVAAPSAGNGVKTALTAGADNQGDYRLAATTLTVLAGTEAEVLTFQNASGSAIVTLTGTGSGASVTGAVAAINTGTAATLGIFALVSYSVAGGVALTIESSSDFSMTSYSGTVASKGLYAASGLTAATIADPDSTATTTGNALAAIASLTSAVSTLGLVQGKVGTGQNKLAYSINLAQSQISNFAAAESRIRDADIASEAANLTKAQVLQQASLAAMAQANSAPQAVLALLRG